MNFKKAIAKILNLKIQSILSRNTNDYWVYKLSIKQVSKVFDTNYRGCFGIFKKRNFSEFVKEYNNLFNTGKKKFTGDIFQLSLFLKHMKLQMMYNSLLFYDGKNAKDEFYLLFGEKYEGLDQIKRITNENNRILDKLSIIGVPIENDNGISFSELIVIVENSRSIAIDREMKLIEFKQIYDLELKKWQTSTK